MTTTFHLWVRSWGPDASPKALLGILWCQPNPKALQSARIAICHLGYSCRTEGQNDRKQCPSQRPLGRKRQEILEGKFYLKHRYWKCCNLPLTIALTMTGIEWRDAIPVRATNLRTVQLLTVQVQIVIVTRKEKSCVLTLCKDRKRRTFDKSWRAMKNCSWLNRMTWMKIDWQSRLLHQTRRPHQSQPEFPHNAIRTLALSTFHFNCMDDWLCVASATKRLQSRVLELGTPTTWRNSIVTYMQHASRDIFRNNKGINAKHAASLKNGWKARKIVKQARGNSLKSC